MLVFLWSLLDWLSCLWSLYQSSIGLLVVIVRLVVLSWSLYQSSIGLLVVIVRLVVLSWSLYQSSVGLLVVIVRLVVLFVVTLPV